MALISDAIDLSYNREKELRDFDETKAGVKGLADSGIINVPKIFARPINHLTKKYYLNNQQQIQVPTVDLSGLETSDRHEEIVSEVRNASEKWGFFQVVNHGIPQQLLDDMIDGVKKFHEQDVEVKKEFYSRDMSRKVMLSSTFDLYRVAHPDWRDTLTISFKDDDNLDPLDFPAILRETTVEYYKNMEKLRDTLLGLFSEALGLRPDHLKGMGCGEDCSFVCHYYPACPQPELTVGAREHWDPDFITILLQDQSGGLQVVHEDQWINVPPLHGGLVVNVGDFLQMVSNDKFKSDEHRVIAQNFGPRISVAFFVTASLEGTTYGPIQELTCDNINPPIYREFSLGEYYRDYRAKEIQEHPHLAYFRR